LTVGRKIAVFSTALDIIKRPSVMRMSNGTDNS